MAPSPLIFIGLVTHPKTRFKDSRTATGAAIRLDAELRGRGFKTCTRICTENLYKNTASRFESARSIFAQKMASIQWHYFLLNKTPPKHKLGIAFLKAFFRAFKDYFSTNTKVATQRLINIELAHLSLMEQALEAKAAWAVIFEDDAICENIEDLADGLLGIIESPQEPSYINLSLSFSPKQLNAEDLLCIDPSLSWKGCINRSILRAILPITNTVCAVAYETSFLEDLLQILKDMGTFPVLPIDWKLNMALIKLYHSKPLGKRFKGCLFIEPGPLPQGSLHANK